VAETEPEDAWLGRDLQHSDAWISRLSDSDVAELRAAVAHARATGKPMRQWQIGDFPLPTLHDRTAGWLEQINRRGFVLVRGVPVDELALDEVEQLYWGLGLHLGTAVSQNTDGDLLGHVRDTGEDPKARGVRLYKTRVEQDFHTDGADIIGLLCLRPAKRGGISRIVSSIAVYREIEKRDPNLIETLHQPFPFDRQGQEAAGESGWFELPIARTVNGRLCLFFIPWYIRESQALPDAPRLTPDQWRAIEMIEAIANDPAFYLDMHFEPGDIQFLLNASILHKRTAYEDFVDPARKRHLLRLWLTNTSLVSVADGLKQGIAPR